MDSGGKFEENPSISFGVMVFVNKQTNKQTDGQMDERQQLHNLSLLRAEVVKGKV